MYWSTPLLLYNRCVFVTDPISLLYYYTTITILLLYYYYTTILLYYYNPLSPYITAAASADFFGYAYLDLDWHWYRRSRHAENLSTLLVDSLSPTCYILTTRYFGWLLFLYVFPWWWVLSSLQFVSKISWKIKFVFDFNNLFLHATSTHSTPVINLVVLRFFPFYFVMDWVFIIVRFCYQYDLWY